MQSHFSHLPLIFNEEQVLSAFYEERKRRSNSFHTPHHSLLQKNSYFCNAFGERVWQKQIEFNNTLGLRQLQRMNQNRETKIEMRKQTKNMVKRRANSQVNALQNIDMASLNKIVIQNTKKIKQQVLNGKDRTRNHASRKQNIQVLESSFKNLTGGVSKEICLNKTGFGQNRKNVYDQNTDVNLLKGKQIYSMGSSQNRIGIPNNTKSFNQVHMRSQYHQSLILLDKQNRQEQDKQIKIYIENDGQKEWGSTQKLKYDDLKQELKSQEFESPKFKTDFCQEQYKVFTHSKVDHSQKETDYKQKNNAKNIKYDILQAQKQLYEQKGTERQRQLEDKLAELKEKYDEMQRINSKQLKFIESVYKMRKTFENTDTDCNLKQLWRWVKNLPHSL